MCLGLGLCLYAYLPPVYLSFGLPLTHTTTLQCSTCTQVTRATRVMGAIRILTDTHHPRANPRAPPPVPWRPFLARIPAGSRTLPRVVPSAPRPGPGHGSHGARLGLQQRDGGTHPPGTRAAAGVCDLGAHLVYGGGKIVASGTSAASDFVVKADRTHLERAPSFPQLGGPLLPR